MERKIDTGFLFDEKTTRMIRNKFCRVDIDADGSDRLFFENAGGSLRLKSVVEISDELNRYPDCFAREHKSSLVLHEYETKGRDDLRTLLNARDGAIATDLTASSLMFKIVEPIVQYGKGTNIVTSVLEHPSAFDACRYFGEKYDKEVRIAASDRITGGILAEDVIRLVDEDTVLLNITAASNMTGAMTDLKTIVTEARKINPDIYVVTDAVQHAPHGVIDVKDLHLDGINIAPYKFFGNRGISFGYVSDRVKSMPHCRILEDDSDIWELGSIVPAHYAAISEIVSYIAWIGAQYTDSIDKRTLVEEGMRRIHAHEQSLLQRMIFGSDERLGLQDMDGVETFFDYSNLAARDLILAMKLKGIDYGEAVREYEKRGIIVYERVAESIYSKRMVESFGLDGIIRVSPLHCNTIEEIDRFLNVTEEILASRNN